MKTWGNLNYLWWVPFTIAYYYGYYWLSIKNNELGGLWFWRMFIFGLLCPGWLIVSRISKNLMFDGMIYDNLMILTYFVTMILLGAGTKFNTVNWYGVGFVVFGSILMRYQTAS